MMTQIWDGAHSNAKKWGGWKVNSTKIKGYKK